MSKRRAGRVVAEYNPLEEWTVTMLRLLLSNCAEAGLFNPATSRAKHTVLNIHFFNENENKNENKTKTKTKTNFQFSISLLLIWLSGLLVTNFNENENKNENEFSILNFIIIILVVWFISNKF